jgi:tetratricopeptide (TPR) repeat protein
MKNMAKVSPDTKKNVSHKKPAPVQKSFPFPEIGILFIGLSLLFSFFPAISRSWGLNYTGCLDGWLTVPFYLLLLLFWLPQTNRYMAEKLSGINRSSVAGFCKNHRYILFLLLGVIAGFCFRLLEIKYIFLGDTDLRAKQIEAGNIAREEYLTMQSIRYVYLFLHEKFNYTGVQTVRLFDYISGGLFIFISLCIANLIGNTFLKKAAVFFTATLSLTALLFFCGYTEIYALPALFLILYLFTALLYLKGKTSVFIPVLVLLAGIASHLMLVCMIPSLVFLIYAQKLWKYPFFRNKKTLVALAVVALPFVYVAFVKFAQPMMLPLHRSDTDYLTMFSFAHYTEFFNSQMLGAGIGFLIWIMTLVYSLVHRIKYDTALLFFLIASLSVTGLIFTFKIDRGSGDWDICSFAPIVYNLANACFLISVYERKLYRNMKYGVLMIAGFSTLHTSAWILTNKTDASIRWLESAFETDPAGYYKRAFNNEAMLAAAFSANKLQDHALKWGKKAYLKYPNDPRMGFNYAGNLLRENRNAEACAILEQSVRKFPTYALPYTVLIEYYSNTKDYESLYRILLTMEQTYRQSPESFTSRLSQEQINQYFGILADLKEHLGK